MDEETRGSFSRRFAAVFCGELVNKGSVIAAFVWLARTLEPPVYGEVEWALSLTTVIGLAADAGLSTWATARIAAKPDEAAATVADVGWLRLALAGPAYLLILAIAASYGGRAGSALAVYGLLLFLAPFFLQYLFNGLLQSWWAALGNALRGAVFAAAVLWLVRPHASPSLVAAAEVVGAGALALSNVLLLRFALDLRVRIRRVRAAWRPILAASWPIGASELTWSVHWYAGLILLGYLATTTDVAWHSASLRLVLGLHTVVWLYLYVLLPTLARLLAGDAGAWARAIERSLRVTGWLGCGAALVGTLGARLMLTTIFGAPFAAAIPAFRAAVWVVPIAWMSGHFRYSLIAAGRPRQDYAAALCGAATTIGLTVLLVPSLASLGAALALLGGTTANAAAAIVMARRLLPSFSLRRSVSPSAGCCLACLLLGAILTPAVGDTTAASIASAVFAACAGAALGRTPWLVAHDTKRSP